MPETSTRPMHFSKMFTNSSTGAASSDSEIPAAHSTSSFMLSLNACKSFVGVSSELSKRGIAARMMK